jgi:tetratricopeptide (TPR) repeat protein
MKTNSLLLAAIVAASVLTGCKTQEKTSPVDSTTGTTTTETSTGTATSSTATGGSTTGTAGGAAGTTADAVGAGGADRAAAPAAPEPDYLKRDIDVNIKEGNAAFQNKEYDRAERILLAALAQCDLYLKQEARQGAILNNLAAIYEEKEMYAQAVPLLNKAQKLFIRAYGRKHAAVYITLGNLGRVLAKQYRWEEAANVYQTAVGLMEEDPKASKSESYKEMLTKCLEAWQKAGNAFKANKIDVKLKAFKPAGN